MTLVDYYEIGNDGERGPRLTMPIVQDRLMDLSDGTPQFWPLDYADVARRAAEYLDNQEMQRDPSMEQTDTDNTLRRIEVMTPEGGQVFDVTCRVVRQYQAVKA